MGLRGPQPKIPAFNPNPSGLCWCGCGALAPIAKMTKSAQLNFKGYPVRFIPGHHKRKSVAPLAGYVIDVTTGCWNWSLCKNKKGYGKLSHGNKDYLAHRYIYEKHIGPIPFDMELDHICLNTSCVNPSHLEVVTKTENLRRKWKNAI